MFWLHCINLSKWITKKQSQHGLNIIDGPAESFMDPWSNTFLCFVNSLSYAAWRLMNGSVCPVSIVSLDCCYATHWARLPQTNWNISLQTGLMMTDENSKFKQSINNVGKTLLLGLQWKQNIRLIGYIMLLSLIHVCISAKTQSSELMKAYLRSTNDGNASWTINGHQGHRQGTKPASSKIANGSSYYSYYSCKNVYSTTANLWLQILLYK